MFDKVEEMNKNKNPRIICYLVEKNVRSKNNKK